MEVIKGVDRQRQRYGCGFRDFLGYSIGNRLCGGYFEERKLGFQGRRGVIFLCFLKLGDVLQYKFVVRFFNFQVGGRDIGGNRMFGF